jgi:Spy/CpxP family protein refolding chaperone
MKTISLAVLLSFVVLSGVALASQSGEQKKRPSRMEEMMKGGKDGEHMGSSMMRIMKMMDQCSAMMESAHADSDKAKESQKQ